MKKTSTLGKLKKECVKIVTEIKLKKDPCCELCGKKASTAHHVIRQSRSNYLRTRQDNLVSICTKCHYKLHAGYEAIYMGQLIKKRGQKWIDKLTKDSRIGIQDTVGYWKNKKVELEEEREEKHE